MKRPVLLLRSFIHIAYLKSNCMFRPFFCHHQVDRISYSRQLYDLIIPHSFDGLAAFHLELLQAILFIAV